MRLFLAITVALVINLFILVLMESMISSDDVRLVEIFETQPIEFLRTDISEDTRSKDRRRQPPPKPAEMERPRAEVTDIAQRATAMSSAASPFEVTSMMGEGGTGGVALAQSLLASAGGDLGIVMAEDLIPLSLVPPQYPPGARMRKVEGWVDLLFVVTEDGLVADPAVTDSEPPDVFDQAAKNAAQRWRFRPTIVDGEPEAVTARIRINFSLEQQ